MVAQLPTPTAGELGSWIVAAAGALAIVFLCLSIYSKVRALQRGPSNRLRRYVTRREFSKHEHATQRRFGELTATVNNIGIRIEQTKLDVFREIHEATGNLEVKLNQCLEATSRLTALVDKQPGE